MNLETLALAVDELVRVPGADRAEARLFGVRLDGGEGPDRTVHVEVLARGEARRIPEKVSPPAGLFAIALAATAWAAPMEPMEGDGTVRTRPSEHPHRRRVHTTVLVGGADGEEVSVLRFADDEPLILRGGMGVVHERLLRCWTRRQLAPAREQHAR